MDVQSLENALEFFEEAVYKHSGETLSDLQKLILREAWEGNQKTYSQIAAEYNYSDKYLQQVVGPKLWQLISNALGQKVSKSNLKVILTQQLTAPENSSKSPAKTEVSAAKNVIELEYPTDSVPLDSPFYVMRTPHEPTCYAAALKVGALIRIKAPRQMGKTSLLKRILAHAKANETQTVTLNFQQAEKQTIDRLNSLLRWICANISRQLNIIPKLDDYWDEDIGSKMSCTLYMEGHLLEATETPIIIAFEEVSELFDYPSVAQEFLTMLRTWHEYTKSERIWRKLRIIMVQSTENYVALPINQSPFNVGLEINLLPFTPEQVEHLIKMHGLHLSKEQLNYLMQLLGGHPYLVRLLLYHWAQQPDSLKELLETAHTDGGIYRDYLHRYLWTLQQYPNLSAAFQQVLNSTNPVAIEQMQAFKLNSMGLVNLHGNAVTLTCNLYRQYFGDKILCS
jgi:AAA-like domain